MVSERNKLMKTKKNNFNEILKMLVREQLNDQEKIVKNASSLFGPSTTTDKETDQDPPSPAEQPEPEPEQEEQPELEKPSKNETEDDGFMSSLTNSMVQTGHSWKRWTNKQIYANNTEQAVANIVTKDPEVSRIKDFFALHGLTCYEGSGYSSAFKDAWAIEDPGTYCILQDLETKLETWYDENRLAFLKKMKKAVRRGASLEKKLEIAEDYSDDFLSTFDYYGFRVEAGARKMVVSNDLANQLLKKCATEHPDFLTDISSQINGTKPCLVDCLVFNLKFVWDLNSEGGGVVNERRGVGNLVKKIFGKKRPGKTPSNVKWRPGTTVNKTKLKKRTAVAGAAAVYTATRGRNTDPGYPSGPPPPIKTILRVARAVARDKSYLPSLKRQKNVVFSMQLRKNKELRKKWVGFCYNMTMDPYGEFELGYWTNNSDKFKTKTNKTEQDMMTDFIANMTYAGIRDTVALNALIKSASSLKTAMAARTTAAAAQMTTAASTGAAGAAPSGGTTLIVAGVVIAVTGFMMWDPFDWFTIVDNVEDNLKSQISLLTRVSNKLGTGATQSDLDREKASYNKLVQDLITMIHKEMLSGIQRDITNVKNMIEEKKILLGNMNTTLKIIRSAMDQISFNKEEIDKSDIEQSKSVLTILLNQVGETSKDASAWNNKVKRDTNLKSDIIGVEQIGQTVNEQLGVSTSNKPNTPSSISQQNSTPVQTDTTSNSDSESSSEEQEEGGTDISDKSMEMWSKIFARKYGIVFFDEDDRERCAKALTKARMLDRNNFKKPKKSLKERFPNAFNYLDDTDAGNLNSQARQFIEWWEDTTPRFGKVVKDPQKVSEFTFLHNSWAQCPNGLKSTTKYRKNEFIKPGLEHDLDAFCGIGLCHSLMNTSFYYTQGFDENIIGLGTSVAKQFYEKSQVQIESDGKIILIPGKISIQTLDLIINPAMLRAEEKEREIENLISKASKKLKSQDLGSSPVLEMKYRTFNILAKLYYKNEMSRFRLARQIIQMDRKVTEFMKTKARELSTLGEDQQNTQRHKGLLSSVRESGAYKIMFFQAIMNL